MFASSTIFVSAHGRLKFAWYDLIAALFPLETDSALLL